MLSGVNQSEQQGSQVVRCGDHCVVSRGQLKISPRWIVLESVGKLIENTNCRVIAVDVSSRDVCGSQIGQPYGVEFCFERMPPEPRGQAVHLPSSSRATWGRGNSSRARWAHWGCQLCDHFRDRHTAESWAHRQRRPRKRPKLDPFLPVIQEILEQDKTAPRKQRHTIKRIFDRLRTEHGYTGGITVVGEVVREWQATTAEVFLPLSHQLPLLHQLPLSHQPGEAQCGVAERG